MFTLYLTAWRADQNLLINTRRQACLVSTLTEQGYDYNLCIICVNGEQAQGVQVVGKTYENTKSLIALACNFYHQDSVLLEADGLVWGDTCACSTALGKFTEIPEPELPLHDVWVHDIHARTYYACVK